MPLLAVGLVLVSCCLHASWNLLLKQARDKLAFTALYLVCSVAVYLPMFLWLAPRSHIPAAGWLCIAGTGTVYFGYFVGIALAYRDGDLSVAYPLMRGLGPALAFAGGIALLHERPSLAGSVGVALILAATFALQRHGRTGRRGLAGPAAVAPVFVGVMYGAYSLIDKEAVGHIGVNPAIYIYLTYTTSCLLVGAFVLARKGWSGLRAEWRHSARACAAVGVLSVFAYLLVLYALSLPNAPASYIVPLRTTSVLLGVIAGSTVLGEGHLAPRLGMALCVMAGITLIAWKG